MKFTLEIDLGNDAMQQPGEVAWALIRVAEDLRRNGFVGVGETCIIRDVNGNGVGHWTVTGTIELEAELRTRIGNTPTCEDCGKALEHCTCEEA